MRNRSIGIESGACRCARPVAARAVIRVTKALLVKRSFLRAVRAEALSNEEGICPDGSAVTAA